MTEPSDKINASLHGRTILVTGANGGLGEQFVLQALVRGASKVYAAARRPRDWGMPASSLFLSTSPARMPCELPCWLRPMSIW